MSDRRLVMLVERDPGLEAKLAALLDGEGYDVVAAGGRSGPPPPADAR